MILEVSNISSDPTAAVLQTIVEILTQYQKEKQTTTRSKPNRGSRLRNRTGLNITEDECVVKIKRK